MTGENPCLKQKYNCIFMKLHSCTPLRFRERISQICEEVSPELIASSVALFGLRNKGIVKEIAAVLEENNADQSPGLFLNKEKQRLIATHEDFRSYLIFVFELFKRDDITGFEDDTLYEGMEFISAVSKISLEQVRSVFEDSLLFEFENEIDVLTLDVYRFMAILYLFCLLEVCPEQDTFPEEGDDEDTDDEGGYDEDDGPDGDDDNDDGPFFPSPGRYQNSYRTRKYSSALLAV